MASRFPRRGEVWLVTLDPTIGHEIQKTRPAVIVTSDLYNRHSPIFLVMPIVSRSTAEYDQVAIRPPDGGLRMASVTLPDQIRAVDDARLLRCLGRLRPETMAQVDALLRVVLDLP